LVIKALEANVLPILSTFPTRPEDEAKSLLLNQVVVQIALDYDLPLLNLNRALAPLPYHGVDPNDTIHLSVPPEGQGRVDQFTPENLQYGFTVRNLVTLQALQAVLAAAGSLGNWPELCTCGLRYSRPPAAFAIAVPAHQPPPPSFSAR
jgi:hypothetical protein